MSPLAASASPTPDLTDLVSELRALRVEVAGLKEAKVPRHSGQRLLSFREAARRLGVSRTRTLPHLVATGRIKTVTFKGRKRIPASEVLRLLETNRRHPAPTSTPSLRAPGARPGDVIRAMRF